MTLQEDIQNAITLGTQYMYNLWKPSIEMFGEYPGLPFWLKIGTTDFIQPGNQQVEITKVPNVPVYSVTLNLKQGWNLISIPVLPDDNSPEAIFAGSYVIPESVSFWDSATEKYISGVGALRPFLGYWVRATANTVVTVTGKVIDTEYILYPGWNLVGSDVFESLEVGPFGNTVIPHSIIAYAYNSSTKEYAEVSSVPVGAGAWLYSNDIYRHVPPGDRYHYRFKRDDIEYTQWVRYYPISIMNYSITPLTFNTVLGNVSLYMGSDLLWSNNNPPIFSTIKREYVALPSIEYGVRHVGMMGRNFFKVVAPDIVNKLNTKLTGWGFTTDKYDVLFGLSLPTNLTAHSTPYTTGVFEEDLVDIANKYYHDCSVSFPVANDYHAHNSKVCTYNPVNYIALIADGDPLEWALSAINIYRKYGTQHIDIVRNLLDGCGFDGNGIKGSIAGSLPAYSTVRLAVYAAARALIGDMDGWNGALACANILLNLQWRGEHLSYIEDEVKTHRTTAHIGGFFVGYDIINGQLVCRTPRPGFPDWLDNWICILTGICPTNPEYIGFIPTNAETTLAAMAALKLIIPLPVSADIWGLYALDPAINPGDSNNIRYMMKNTGTTTTNYYTYIRLDSGTFQKIYGPFREQLEPGTDDEMEHVIALPTDAPAGSYRVSVDTEYPDGTVLDVETKDDAFSVVSAPPPIPDKLNYSYSDDYGGSSGYYNLDPYCEAVWIWVRAQSHITGAWTDCSNIVWEDKTWTQTGSCNKTSEYGIVQIRFNQRIGGLYAGWQTLVSTSSSISYSLNRSPTVTPPPQGLLFGYVYDSVTGFAVQGATVTLVGAGRSASTNISGYYGFSGLSTGGYTMKVTRSGYSETGCSTFFDNTVSLRIDFPMTAIVPTSKIWGYVRDAIFGWPVVFATVTCTTTGASAASNDNGIYWLDPLMSGLSLPINASNPTYQSQTKYTAFDGYNSVRLDFGLNRI